MSKHHRTPDRATTCPPRIVGLMAPLVAADVYNADRERHRTAQSKPVASAPARTAYLSDGLAREKRPQGGPQSSSKRAPTRPRKASSGKR